MVYKLRAKYGGIDPSDAKRLKQLEDENAKLRRLLADAMLDNVVLKDLLGKPDNADATAGRSAACDAGSSGLFALRLRPDRCRSEDRAARQAARQPGNP